MSFRQRHMSVATEGVELGGVKNKEKKDKDENPRHVRNTTYLNSAETRL